MISMGEKQFKPQQAGAYFPSRRLHAEDSYFENLLNGHKEDGVVETHRQLFDQMVATDYQKICGLGHIKELTRGQMVYIEGDNVEQVFLLTSGLVKITKLGQSGAEVILRLGAVGDVLGAVGLFTSGAHCATAQALRDCRAMVWDAPAFRSLVEVFPILHHNLIGIVEDYLVELEERFQEVATERVAPRVARQLVRLLRQIGEPVEKTLEINLSREELAQMTGTTLFSVSRLLSAWEALGMIKSRREVVCICNIPLLCEIAEHS